MLSSRNLANAGSFSSPAFTGYLSSLDYTGYLSTSHSEVPAIERVGVCENWIQGGIY